jgi:small subunit ribosomal protein S17
MERNKRKVYTGTVVSDKMEKTITVAVESKQRHKLYGKQVKRTKKFTAHDENSVAKQGDIVTIMETRPLSKNKRFRLVEVVKESIEI